MNPFPPLSLSLTSSCGREFWSLDQPVEAVHTCLQAARRAALVSSTARRPRRSLSNSAPETRQKHALSNSASGNPRFIGRTASAPQTPYYFQYRHPRRWTARNRQTILPISKARYGKRAPTPNETSASKYRLHFTATFNHLLHVLESSYAPRTGTPYRPQLSGPFKSSTFRL